MGEHFDSSIGCSKEADMKKKKAAGETIMEKGDGNLKKKKNDSTKKKK